MMTNNVRSRFDRNQRLRARGFTLIELSVVLVILGLVALFAVELIPKLTDRIRLDQTAVDLDRVDEAVIGFALANNRLPCPDTNNDGVEDCAAAVGALPFRTMGLPGPALDRARLPLRYGVYRNGPSADLAALTELFEPALPDALTIFAGTVQNCNTTAPPLPTIVYSNKDVTTLKLSGVTGSFATDDFVGFVDLSYTGLTLSPPPPPSSPGTFPFLPPLFPAGTLPNCPCGITGGFPGAVSCTTCTGFTVGRSITSDTTDDDPVAVIRVITITGPTSGTLDAFPGGVFSAGVVSELYQAPNPGSPPLAFERTIANPDFTFYTGLPPNPFPPTITTDSLLTGVSATVTPGSSKSAHVVSATNLGGGFWDLVIDQLPVIDTGTPPDVIETPNPFVAGDIVFGPTTGNFGTVISQTTVLATPFTDGETVATGSCASPSASAVMNPGSDTGSSFTVNSVVGTFNGPTQSGTTRVPGDTLIGCTSGAQAEVLLFFTPTDGVTDTPIVTPGTISFAPTVSGQTNELDFCQGLRNGIAAAGDTGSASFVNTVNQQTPAITINPAYVLVSGGVEDASGDGLDVAFDQRNEITSPLDFESPARLRNDSSLPASVYDDVVAARSMRTLAYEFACARNIGAVNALAVDATALRNIAEVAFDRNEQALSLIRLSFRSLELAKLDRDIKAVQIVLNAVGILITVYKQLVDPEGAGAFTAAAAVAVIALGVSIGDLVIADGTVDAAKSTYEGACTGHGGPGGGGTFDALTDAAAKAATALSLGLRADAWGGVQ